MAIIPVLGKIAQALNPNNTANNLDCYGSPVHKVLGLADEDNWWPLIKDKYQWDCRVPDD